MLEFIRLARKRGAIADVFYIIFNLAFVALTFALIVIFPDTPWPAVVLLLISKWRTVAVRPRYWWMNIVSSLPDLSFGAAIVVLMWLAGQNAMISGGIAWIAQLSFAAIYAGWLIWVKPKEGKNWVFIQAGVSQFFSFAAIFSVANRLSLAPVMILAFIIAFGVARQIFTQYVETSRTLLAIIYGFIVAVISFAAWHWTVGYAVGTLIEIPQVAIVIAAFGFALTKLYDAHQTSSIKWQTVGWPVVACGAIVFLVVIIGGALFV